MELNAAYFVPRPAFTEALADAARRGVDVRIVVPGPHIDKGFVRVAGRAAYAPLLEAGVRIFEYVGGLLHAKSMTVDGEVTLIGSANIDRRSFELNFENNILLVDPGLTLAMRERQIGYVAASTPVDAADVVAWSRRRVIWNNAVAMLGPVL